MQENTEVARSARYEKLTETPIPKLISGLAVPTIVSMMVTGIYNTADTFFVGRISTQATAAVGIVFSVMSIIQALGFFCGHGSGSFISRMLGGGKTEEAEEMAATGFCLAFFLGTILMVTGLVFLRPLCLLLGSTATTIGDTQAYMRIILLGAPYMTAQLVINNQLRFQGSAVYAMVGLVTGAVLNIGLDPLLIFVLHMGVPGAALATILAQFVSFCILWIGSHRGPNLHIKIRKARFTPAYLLEIVNGGSPSLFRQGLNGISVIMLNTTAGMIGGDAAIAGMSVVGRLSMLVNSALIGFGQGMQPVVAFNYGAALYDRVRQAYRFCVKYGTVFLLLVSGIFFISAEQVVEFFRSDPEVVRIGAAALRWQMAMAALNGTNIMANMLLQSVGKGVRATILAASRSGIFFIPLLLILSRIFGLRGVEMTQAWADAFSFVLALPLVYSFMREMEQAKKAN